MKTLIAACVALSLTACGDSPSDDQLETCGNDLVEYGEDCDGSAECDALCRLPAPPGAVVLHFEGTVWGYVDETGALRGMRLGAGIWGRIVYPADAEDQLDSPERGSFVYENLPPGPPELGLWVRFGPWRLGPDHSSQSFSTYDDADDGTQAFDGIQVETAGAIGAPDLPGEHAVQFRLQDDTLTALSTDALPVTAIPDRSAWTEAEIVVSGRSPEERIWEVWGGIERLSLP